MRGETKSVDMPVTATGFTLNSAVASLPLNICLQGASYNQHIGNKICMKSLYFNAYVYLVATNASAVTEYVRAIIVYDRQTNGAAPLWSDIIQAITQSSATSNLTLDGLNILNRDRFSVLMDFRLNVPALPLVAAALTPGFPQPTSEEARINRFIPLKNLECMFKANGGTVGDISTGGLFLVMQSSVGGQFGLSWSARLRFEDN